jgi:uncharacterized short protein YbdD (DUF466 family)
MPDLPVWLCRLRETAHLMVGLPDYRRYVAHRTARHPGEPVMSRSEFVLERLNRRLGGTGPGRCC